MRLAESTDETAVTPDPAPADGSAKLNELLSILSLLSFLYNLLKS